MDINQTARSAIPVLFFENNVYCHMNTILFVGILGFFCFVLFCFVLLFILKI